MSTSQNGWPVDPTGGRQDEGAILGSVHVPNGILAGDVATVFRWLAKRFDSEVEKLKAGTCWGWYNRAIRDSHETSNHASGTAVDFNADQHPLGTAAASTFSAKQITAIRKIVTDSGGVLRWGGDYSGRKDPMHFEINASAAKVKALANKIRAGSAPGQEDDVTPQDKQDIINGVVAALTKEVKLNGADGKPDGTYETPIGKAALSQGIPDGMDPKGARQPAWVVLRNLAKAVYALAQDVAQLKSKA